MNEWITAVLIINFNHTNGQEVKVKYPNNVLSNSTLSDIAMLAMPENLDNDDDNKHNFQYMFRVREKSDEDNIIDIFHYCYVNFSQIKMNSEKRGYFQQSIVIVTSQPYNIYSNLVIRLSTVLNDVPQFQVLLNNNEDSESIIDTTLQVAFKHFQSWPKPIPGKELKLPFYGEIFELLVPFNAIYTSLHNNQNRSFNHLLREKGLESGNGLYEINLVQALDSLGLLPHLWTLWELLVKGNNVLVFSSSATVCSTVVSALLSLLAPLSYAGDHRPYISPYDSDIKLLSESFNRKYNNVIDNCDKEGIDVSILSDVRIITSPASVYTYNVRSKNRKPNKDSNIVIGVTNPFLLREFANIDAVLFLPNLTSKSKSNSSSLFSMLSTSLSRSNLLAYETNFHLITNGETFETIYDEWIHSNKSKVGGLICLRQHPTIMPDKDIQKRLMSLNSTIGVDGKSEKIIVGGMLLREHFRRLTNSLLKPFDSLFSRPDDPFTSLITTKSICTLFLSSNTDAILSAITINDIIFSISSNSNFMLTMPSVLQRAEWKIIINKFSLSKTFSAWKQSRRDLLLIRLWLDSSLYCENLTNIQFLDIFKSIIIKSENNSIIINDAFFERLLQKLVLCIDFLTTIKENGLWVLQGNIDADKLVKAMQSHLDYLLDYRNKIMSTNDH